MSENLVPVLIVLIVVGLPVMGGVLIKLAKIVKGEGSSESRSTNDADDAQILQDMHQMLNRLEKRIDAIETIIDDRNSR
jgi:hypothetical protein